MLGKKIWIVPRLQGVHLYDTFHRQNLTDYFLTADICVIQPPIYVQMLPDNIHRNNSETDLIVLLT